METVEMTSSNQIDLNEVETGYYTAHILSCYWTTYVLIYTIGTN